ncbi:MAG: family 20 glycosylhydrolase [Arcicella sp.]|jgi:hexosaminidase|nr:family 20 glycosylhydrolase [Arcicella sp.]
MNKILIILLFWTLQLSAQTPIHIIPEPSSLQKGMGDFILTRDTKISIINPNAEVRRVAQFFIEMVNLPTGYKLSTAENIKFHSSKSINFILDEKMLAAPDQYTLNVTTKFIDIKAHSPQGMFYAVQTLMQLLPKQIENNTFQKTIWKIPAVNITDAPRYDWRGIMLDVSRHFFPKEYIKKFIDQLARLKFNTFHWHLTDDQGWRIEIKSYPKLTSVGAWRVQRTGKWWEREPAKEGEERSYGGFYTQEDIREIVKYAQDRYISILPEVDVPGHSLAILAAYPEFSCGGGKFEVNAGVKFYKDVENTLCPSNEQVYVFLDKVFGEISQLFPHPYIHIGGDEAYKGYWEKSAECQALMKREGLKTQEELQSYFVKRVEKIVQSKGKRLIGWDEILEGGLAPNATVMSWRGMKGGIAAAKQNHQVVMSPWEYVYLDLYQGDPNVEPVTYGMARLKKAYSFEPTPKGVEEKLILGGQGNLWTESVPTTRHLEYMLYPRILAISETLWSLKEKKNWQSFTQKLETHFARLDEAKLNYALSMYDAIVRTEKDAAGKIKIELSTEVDGMDIYYTFDGTNPDNYSPKYRGQMLEIPKSATTLKVITYQNNKPKGKQITLTMKDLQDRVGRYKIEFFQKCL